jgi:hypothetical protein
MVAANVSRFSLFGLKQRIVSTSRTAHAAVSCAPACHPDGAEDADGPRVFAGEISDTEAVGGADANALHDAVG